MFAMSFKLSTAQSFYSRVLPVIEMRMYTAQVRIYCSSVASTTFLTAVEQIWNLCITLFIFACFCTVVALFRPRGPQPAAYGHLQTLANLVDEWSPVMWWGHKEDEIPYCHAGMVHVCLGKNGVLTLRIGTSDHPLLPVKMDCVYAGSCVGIHPPVSLLGSQLQTYT
jgi:hypothetical protein